MLNSLQLTNFKCFDSLYLSCAPLTLLCGLNGMGKSSVFHALLVLRQSYSARELDARRLMLSGELTELGTGQDVLFEGAESDVVEFEFHRSDIATICRLSFDYSRTSDQLVLKSDARGDRTSGAVLPNEWRHGPPFGGDLLYVSAERIGPRKIYDRSETLARRGELGVRGEHTVNYLDAQRDVSFKETDPRCVEPVSHRLTELVDYWLQDVTPGVHLQLQSIPHADALLGGFSFERPGDVATRRYRPTNVGFGLSYVLPVLAALLAPPGTLCLIENPEAHLHPRGQTKLAELAVRAALAGVQVIVETHSDHFMDGVRIAVHEGLTDPSNTAFHFFGREGGRTVVTSPQVDINGRLSSWPEGFFGQHELNLAKLMMRKS